MFLPIIAREIATDGYASANLRKWRYKNRLYQWHLERYLSRLQHHLNSCRPAGVLDVGCGEGIVCRALRELGCQSAWAGCDVNHDALRAASKLVRKARFVRAEICNLPYANRSFDLVLCTEVLEHVPDPERALREIARVSRQWLLLSVPLEPCFRTLTWTSRFFRLGGDPGHVNFWTPAAFRRFVAQTGKLIHWERSAVYQIALVELPQPVG